MSVASRTGTSGWRTTLSEVTGTRGDSRSGDAQPSDQSVSATSKEQGQSRSLGTEKKVCIL